MRLSHIKLAGFKSFVDPSHFPLPGQIVGIVGPNGCGKSNVIDALRWVLGESKASALRGESMQDVIFNGSGQRKAVLRASVELIFDNSLGKAAGQWSSYAEIAIKRVLLRNGESTYFINNQKVRRKDITDIFLGTGLGARAYAIVEQGMISRIIEARPEELRVFLEEAAGVSKYRDRRRETELRLNDTRDHLLRVGDILQEMEQQLTHLAVQAETAQRYRERVAERDTAQQLIWLAKQQQAQTRQQSLQRELMLRRTELESRTADLRACENRLEQLRSGHYQLTDELSSRQGELYAANSTVLQLEQQIRHAEAERQRLAQQSGQLARQRAQQQEQVEHAQSQLEHWRQEQGAAALRFTTAGERLDEASARLPQAEAAARRAETQLHGLRAARAQVRQRSQLAEMQHAQLQRSMQQLEARRSRLLLERDNLPQADEAALQQAEQAWAASVLEQAQEAARLDELHAQEAAVQAARSQHETAMKEQERQAAMRQARLAALQEMQRRLAGDGDLSAWLHRQHLAGKTPLWQALHIEPGWEVALEAVLRERLNALELDALRQVTAWTELPPARLALFVAADETTDEAGVALAAPAGLRALSEVIGCQQAVLHEWLAGVFVAADLDQALNLRALLPNGACLVTPAGHLLTRNSVLCHAPDSQLSGVLARQREIEQLELKKVHDNQIIEEIEQRLGQTVAQCREIETQLTALRSGIAQRTQRQHDLQIQILKLQQLRQQHGDRSAQIGRECLELNQSLAGEQGQCAELALQCQRLQQELNGFQPQLDAAEQQARTLQQTWTEARETLVKLQHEAHEAQFGARHCSEKIADWQQRLGQSEAALQQAAQQLQQLQSECHATQDDLAAQQLQQALLARKTAEDALAEVRNRLEQTAGQLQHEDRLRLSCEQQLHALREQLAALTLKEQEARLYFEQWATQLAGVDEQALMPKLASLAQLQSEHQRLSSAVDALGAVNLAALDELQQANERKNYLAAQAEDLQQAMTTLLDAIRHIDRESRSLLLATFNRVNEQLAELFPVLFAGGEAKLVLTGEEILDSGVQVMAQPPGKKNSSIHLLSGGEKALTAIALIFSLFQLNPAPFCLLDEVDAPLDDTNTERLCALVRKMAQHTQFVFISHNKIAMAMAEQLIGITMQEKGVSRVVSVDIEAALQLGESVRV